MYHNLPVRCLFGAWQNFWVFQDLPWQRKAAKRITQLFHQQKRCRQGSVWWIPDGQSHSAHTTWRDTNLESLEASTKHLQNDSLGQIILSFKVSFLLKIFENDDKSCTFFCQYLVSFPRLQLLMTFVDAFQQVLQGFQRPTICQALPHIAALNSPIRSQSWQKTNRKHQYIKSQETK